MWRGAWGSPRGAWGAGRAVRESVSGWVGEERASYLGSECFL